MTSHPAQRSIAIPRLLHVGADCLSGIAALLESHAFNTSTVCVASGGGPSIALAERVMEGLRGAGVHVITRSHLRGTLEQAASMAGLLIEESVALVVAVGGGRVIDTAKLAAARTGVDFLSVPTTMAHDGISSPVASLAGKDGLRRSYAAAMPAGIVVDVDVIGSAPARTLRAGVGDLASNLTAVLDWQLAERQGKERYDAFSAMIAESAAWPVLAITDLTLPETHEFLARGLLLSGLAMAAAGTSRPCSGAEHLISHSLDGSLGDQAAMHGEQVALGCLVSAAAHESPLLEEFRELFTRLALPTAPGTLGISNDAMARAICEAPATRPDRYTILSEISTDPDALAGLLDRAFAP